MRNLGRRPPAVATANRTLPELLELHERLIIVQTLSQNGFSRKRAAAALGISRVALWRRMQKLEINVKRTTPGRPSKKIFT